MQISSDANKRILVLLTDIESNPYQMRTSYDEALVTALATSIQEVGLLQIPIARKHGKKFQLCFGHRRKKAFEQLFLSGQSSYKEMPLLVHDLTDQEMFEISLTENLKREDLNPIEKAIALKLYMNQFGASSVLAAKLFGIPESTIRGTVRLLKLPEEDQQKLRSGKLTQHAARKLLEKPDTQLKRLQVQEDDFHLRDQLIILLYGEMRTNVSDQLLFKKVKSIIETNQQLERQVELMNRKNRSQARLASMRVAA